MDQFVVKDLQIALALDGLNSSHPIITGATDPDEINSLFDSISYDKVLLLWQPVCICIHTLAVTLLLGWHYKFLRFNFGNNTLLFSNSTVNYTEIFTALNFHEFNPMILQENFHGALCLNTSTIPLCI